MEKNWIELVAEFHEVRGDIPLAIKYFDLDRDVELLRIKLMATELGELVEAMHIYDKEQILDALCDLTYVVLGTVVSYGLLPVFDAAFREVHRSNMSKDHRVKAGQKYGPSGKGASYEPPDLQQFIDKLTT
jgi:NTP pyrophosphatase (non-canonical NTP hydrolase)